MTTTSSPHPPATPDPVPPGPPMPPHTGGIKATRAPKAPGAPRSPEKLHLKGVSVAGKGVFQRGKPAHKPITWYLRCPQCLHIQVEQKYADQFPSHMGCEACGKVIPSVQWLVVAYHNLGGHVAPMKDRLGRPAPAEMGGV